MHSRMTPKSKVIYLFYPPSYMFVYTYISVIMKPSREYVDRLSNWGRIRLDSYWHIFTPKLIQISPQVVWPDGTIYESLVKLMNGPTIVKLSLRPSLHFIYTPLWPPAHNRHFYSVEGGGIPNNICTSGNTEKIHKRMKPLVLLL